MSDWINALLQQTAAASSIKEEVHRLGLPTSRDEHWKHSPLRAFERACWPLAQAVKAPEVEQAAAQVLNDWSVIKDVPRLVFYRGQWCQSASKPLPAGVQLRQQATADAVSVRHEHPGIKALTAGLSDGVLHIDWSCADAPVEPLHLCFIDDGEQPSLASYRIQVNVSAGAVCTLLETHHTLGSGGGGLLQEIDTHVAAGGACTHVRFQGRQAAGAQISSHRITVAEKGYFQSVHLAQGMALNRHTLSVNLQGEGARVDVRELALARRAQHVDCHTEVIHAAVNGRSELCSRGILDDRSQVVFNGRVHVVAGADGTDSAQSNRNLLLSDKARVYTKPELEIYADEVKCSHGATTGCLDTQALFYLRSRGLSERDARCALLQAFAHEVIGAVPHEGLRNALTKTVNEWVS